MYLYEDRAENRRAPSKAPKDDKYIHTQRPESKNFQIFALQLLLHEILEAMLLIISSCLTQNFENLLVCRKIILLGALMILFISAPCVFMRFVSL